MHKSYRAGILIGLLVPVVIWAGNAVLPFTFTSGAPIRASEVNGNFAALRDAINSGQSGTRLKRLVYKSADGLNVSVENETKFWDSQFQITCERSASSSRCLPFYNGIFGSFQSIGYSDSTCTRLVLVIGNGDLFAKIINNYSDAGLPEAERFAVGPDGGVFQLGGVETGPYYSSFNCSPSGTSVQYRPLTTPEPISNFARIELAIE